MTAYGPRAIVKSIKASDLTVASGNAQTFDIKVPAAFWIDQCFVLPKTTFTASTSVTSINVIVGVGTGDLDNVFMTEADCKALSTPTRTAAGSLTEDDTYILNGQGVVDMDSEGTVKVKVTPTWVGAKLTAGEIIVVLLGYQLPYPA